MGVYKTKSSYFSNNEEKEKIYKKQIAKQGKNELIQGHKLQSEIANEQADELTVNQLASLFKNTLKQMNKPRDVPVAAFPILAAPEALTRGEASKVIIPKPKISKPVKVKRRSNSGTFKSKTGKPDTRLSARLMSMTEQHKQYRKEEEEELEEKPESLHPRETNPKPKLEKKSSTSPNKKEVFTQPGKPDSREPTRLITMKDEIKRRASKSAPTSPEKSNPLSLTTGWALWPFDKLEKEVPLILQGIDQTEEWKKCIEQKNKKDLIRYISSYKKSTSSTQSPQAVYAPTEIKKITADTDLRSLSLQELLLITPKSFPGIEKSDSWKQAMQQTSDRKKRDAILNIIKSTRS